MKATDQIQAIFRRQLEQRRQEIAGLERLVQTPAAAAGQAQRRAEGGRSAGRAPHYVAAMAERRARIVQSLAEVDVKIRQARDGLSEAYHGVRRSEIAASARAEQNRRRAG